MDLALKDVSRNGAADQGGRDIVKEARQHEYQEQQRHAALPVVGQQRRHFVRNPALLEVPRQKRKSHQQQEQISEDDPLMRHVLAEAAQSRTEFESGEDELVDDDGRESGQRDRKRVTMKQRHAEQGQREQDEIDGYSKHQHGLDHLSIASGRKTPARRDVVSGYRENQAGSSRSIAAKEAAGC